VKRFSSSDSDAQVRLRTAGVFIFILLILAVGLSTAGYLYYNNYVKTYNSVAYQQLLTIAELKTGQLVQYRKERLEDGNIFFKNASFASLVRRFFEQPADVEVSRQLVDWMGGYLVLKDCNQIQLLDVQGITRWALPAHSDPVPSQVAQGISDVLQSGQMTLLDFYRNENDQRIYLSVLVPIFDESDTNRPLGVLDMRIDPSVHFYPLIKKWPVPSETAETLLVRREGNEVVFLNELRFQTNAALNLRVSVKNTIRPSVMAVFGGEGIVQGIDYRGVPVLSAVRAIPNSPWFMVARQDKAEIQAPVRSRLVQTVFLFGSLFFGGMAFVGIFWRQQRVGFYREKAKSSEALYEANEILHIAMNQSSAGIAIADAPDGKLRYVNEAGLLIGGSSREQLVDGIGIDQYVASWKLFNLDGTVMSAEQVPLARALKYGEANSCEFIIRRGEHDDRFVLAKAKPITNALGKITAGIVVFLDVTEQKETTLKLVETMEHLKVSNRDLEQFAYIASHDLQEPLRMVANYMQLIERRYKDNLDQDAKDFIGFAVDGAVRMQQLIDSLLDYSRLQTRNKPFESVDLDKVLQRVLRDLEGRVLETGAKITSGRLPQIRGDGVQLGMVFQNLISNALKFKGAALPEIHVSAEEFSTHWKITVRDNGIGIAPEHQERIFKIFQRLHSRAEYSGTGIGLAVCRRVIETHGGETGVESEVEKGSVFWFTLPKKGER
jgi:signal transduction histidine kinase